MTPHQRPGRRPAPPQRRGSGQLPQRASTQQRPPRRSGGELGGEQVEGRQAVRELLAAGVRPVREVWIADGVERSGSAAEIAALAQRLRVPVSTVPRARLDAAAGTDAPQGVLAYAEPVAPVELAALAQPGPGRPAPFLVVLDGITDPHNVGAVLRSALGAGATGAVISRHRAGRLGPAALKAAAGAVEYLPIALVAGIPAALAALREAGAWIAGLDAGGTSELWRLDVATEALALVLGAEGHGLSRLARERCDVVVRIPMAGPLGSLNVAAAGALACFEVARRRTAAGG